MRRLLFDANDSAACNFSDTKAARIGDLLEQNLSARRLPAEIFGGFQNILLNDVVAQNDAQPVAVRKVFGQREGVRNAAFAFLIGVAEVLQAELLAVREQPQKVARVFASGDDQDIANPGVDKRLDRVINHRLIVNRKQVLVGDLRQRIEAAARAARQDYAFHRLPYAPIYKLLHDTISSPADKPFIASRKHRRENTGKRGRNMSHYRWEEIKREELSPLLSRRVIHSERMTVANFEMKKGAQVPLHSHDNEQISTVWKGRVRFNIGGEDQIVEAGKAVAEALAAEGVRLALCSRNENTLAAVAEQIRQRWGVPVFDRALDVTD